MLDLTLFDGDELLALARVDAEAGRVDCALAKVKQALKQDKYPIGITAMGAKLYAQLGLFAHAKALYKDYLSAVPEATTEFFQLGMVNFDSGDHQAALVIWQELLQKIPTHPPALFYSALAKIEIGNVDDAKRDLDVLLKSAPADNLYAGRGQALLASLDKNNQLNKDEAVPVIKHDHDAGVYGPGIN